MLWTLFLINFENNVKESCNMFEWHQPNVKLIAIVIIIGWFFKRGMKGWKGNENVIKKGNENVIKRQWNVIKR